MIISQFLFFLLGLVLCLFGTAYVLRGRLMPYHEQFLGIKQNQVPLKWQALASQSIRIIGGFKLGTGASILLINSFFFLDHPHLVKIIFLILLIPPFFFLVIACYSVGHRIPRSAVALLVSLLTLGILIQK